MIDAIQYRRVGSRPNWQVMLSGRGTVMSHARPKIAEGDWRKSSHSNTNGECVEVSVAKDGVAVRDSLNSKEGVLSYSAAHWIAFIESIK